MWDVVVVGAGPAGSAAALSATATNPSARVLLLDRSDFPRDKPCGDGIPPPALDVLSGLGVGGAAAGFRPVHTLRLGFLDGMQVEGTVARPAYVVPRQVFDARLVAAAVARGVTFARHRVRRVQQTADAVVLDHEIEARVVVAADGANSAMQRLVNLPATPGRHVALAIRGYAPVGRASGDKQVITFAPVGWPAYAWSFPIGDGRANIGYGEVARPGHDLTRAHLLRCVERLLPELAAGATDWRAHHLPLSSGRPRQPNGRILFAGDALSLINPLTGEGIYYAVTSGALAGWSATSVAGPGAGAVYRGMLRRQLGRHLRHTSVAARLATHHWMVERALRAGRAPDVFDDLVEIGLGRGVLTTAMIGGMLRPSKRRSSLRRRGQT